MSRTAVERLALTSTPAPRLSVIVLDSITVCDDLAPTRIPAAALREIVLPSMTLVPEEPRIETPTALLSIVAPLITFPSAVELALAETTVTPAAPLLVIVAPSMRLPMLALISIPSPRFAEIVLPPITTPRDPPAT